MCSEVKYHLVLTLETVFSRKAKGMCKWIPSWKNKDVSKCVCLGCCQMCFEGREDRRKGERRKVDAGKSLEEVDRLFSGHL